MITHSINRIKQYLIQLKNFLAQCSRNSLLSWAIEYYDASSATPSVVQGDIAIQRQQLTTEQISNLGDQARIARPKGLALKDFDSIVLIVSSAVLGILRMRGLRSTLNYHLRI
jgi:hypothetical protein